MSDPYRDFEASLTGRQRGGIGVLGWITVAFFGFSAIGAGAVWMAYRFVKGQVHELVERVDEGPAATATRMLTRLDPSLRLVDVPGGPSTLVRSVETGESFDVQDLIDGSLRLRTGEGVVSLRLRGDEDGGTLVIDSPEGRLSARLTRDGEDGGSLVIDTPEGSVSAELVRDGEDGALVVRTDEGELLRIGAGREALALPSWLPRRADMPDAPGRLYSAHTDAGRVGAVTWETEREPASVLEDYAEAFEDLGFESVSKTSSHRDGRSQVSLWARDEGAGRTAFVVAADEGARTFVVLGYAER